MKSTFRITNLYTYDKQIHQIKYSTYAIFVFSFIYSLNWIFPKVT